MTGKRQSQTGVVSFAPDDRRPRFVVHEAPRTCGFGAELVSFVTEKAFLHLEAPPVRVTGYDTPFPYTLENEYLPLLHRILPALFETARY